MNGTTPQATTEEARVLSSMGKMISEVNESTSIVFKAS